MAVPGKLTVKVRYGLDLHDVLAQIGTVALAFAVVSAIFVAATVWGAR